MNSSRKERLDNCGKYSVALENKKDKRKQIRLARCSLLECPHCQPQILKQVESNIRYYSQKYDLHFFNTITSKKGFEDLMDLFNKLIKKVRYEFDVQREMQKHNKSLEDAERWQGKKIKDSVEKDLKIELKKITKGFAVIEVAKDKNFYYKGASLKGKKQFRDLNKKDIGKKQKSLYNSVNAEKGKYKNLKEKVRKKIERRFNWGLDKKLEYIGSVELHEKSELKGEPHLHFLTNFYIPHYIFEELTEEHNSIYDNSFIVEDAEEKNQLPFGEFNLNVDALSAYVTKVTKYVTKDTVEKFQEMQEKEIESPFIASKSISLFTDKEKESEFEIIKRFKVPIKSTAIDYDGEMKDINDFVKKHSVALKELSSIHLMEKIHNLNINEELKWNFIVYRRLKEISKQKLKLVAGTVPKGLDEKQLKVVESFIENPITLLVGRAGTGKSFTLSKILKSISVEDLRKTFVVSYTGKASARVRELLVAEDIEGIKPLTIHKMCSADFQENFLKNEHNLIDSKILIIDEVGMIPRYILAKLLLAIPSETRVLMAGDDRQLPPVNDISIIPELRGLPFINSFNLEKVYRSGEKVIDIAQDILNFKKEKIPFKVYNESEEFQKYIIEVVNTKSYKDFQILTNTKAMKNKINSWIQKGKTEITDCFGDYNYEIGDKILITRNNSMKQVSNGDSAILIDYNSEGVILELLDKRKVFYEYRETEQIEPAFAITTHKSQGSEYLEVMLIVEDQKQLNTNNLLYTAVTRAKKEVTIFAPNEKIVTHMVANVAVSQNIVTLTNVIDLIIKTKVKKTS